MRKNVVKVVEAFLVGKRAKGDSKGTVWTDGQTIFSYDMPIAQRRNNRSLEVISSEAGPTATTRSQIRAVLFCLEQHGQLPRVVACLTGRKPHVFRDQAPDRSGGHVYRR